MGAYSRWVLYIRGGCLFKVGRLLNCHYFQQEVVCLFCNKSKYKGNNKTQRCNKASFCKINTLKKTLSSGKSLISTYSFLLGGRGKGGGFWLWAHYLSLSGRERGWVCI